MTNKEESAAPEMVVRPDMLKAFGNVTAKDEEGHEVRLAATMSSHDYDLVMKQIKGKEGRYQEIATFKETLGPSIEAYQLMHMEHGNDGKDGKRNHRVKRALKQLEVHIEEEIKALADPKKPEVLAALLEQSPELQGKHFSLNVNDAHKVAVLIAAEAADEADIANRDKASAGRYTGLEQTIAESGQKKEFQNPEFVERIGPSFEIYKNMLVTYGEDDKRTKQAFGDLKADIAEENGLLHLNAHGRDQEDFLKFLEAAAIKQARIETEMKLRQSRGGQVADENSDRSGVRIRHHRLPHGVDPTIPKRAGSELNNPDYAAMLKKGPENSGRDQPNSPDVTPNDIALQSDLPNKGNGGRGDPNKSGGVVV